MNTTYDNDRSTELLFALNIGLRGKFDVDASHVWDDENPHLVLSANGNKYIVKVTAERIEAE